MSFAVIDPKFLIMINNYPSYDGQNFWSYIHNLWVRWIAQIWVLNYTTFFLSPLLILFQPYKYRY